METSRFKKIIFFSVLAVFFLVFFAIIYFHNEIEKISRDNYLNKGIFGMRIEKVLAGDEKIEITTTGAKFLLKEDGIMSCWQRIPKEREVARLVLPKETWPFKVEKKDDFTYILSGNGVNLTVSGDSLVIIEMTRDLSIDFNGFFKPEYHAEKEGKWLFIDATGGFGVYPVEKKQTDIPEFSIIPWNISYIFKSGEEAWFSVFPPRPYNWARVFQPIAHTGSPKVPYPPDELINFAAQYTKIFTIHSLIWPGGDKEPWLIPKFIPSDIKEFTRVRDKVHQNEMKFVVYTSPYYSTAPDFFAEIKRVLEEYKVDGLYFDGISFDFRKSYYTVRKAREMLGDDRILYIHASVDPFFSNSIYAPFIDTYADYILRGEAGRPGGLGLQDFLRWTVSGYNISNAVGYWVYYGSTENVQSEYIFHFPKSEDIDIALENNVYLVWSESWYGEDNLEGLEKFSKEYYNKLKALQEKKDFK
jgi:hypothetical protein